MTIPPVVCFMLTSCCSLPPINDNVESRWTEPMWHTDHEHINFVTCCNFGICPTAGMQTLHFNNKRNGGGEAYVVFDQEAIPGRYIITLDVGNPNNHPFAKEMDIGLTTGGIQGVSKGTPVIPDKSERPEPAPGKTVEWREIVTIRSGDVRKGDRLGFYIHVPPKRTDGNVLVDNLKIIRRMSGLNCQRIPPQ